MSQKIIKVYPWAEDVLTCLKQPRWQLGAFEENDIDWNVVVNGFVNRIFLLRKVDESAQTNIKSLLHKYTNPPCNLLAPSEDTIGNYISEQEMKDASKARERGNNFVKYYEKSKK